MGWIVTAKPGHGSLEEWDGSWWGATAEPEQNVRDPCEGYQLMYVRDLQGITALWGIIELVLYREGSFKEGSQMNRSKYYVVTMPLMWDITAEPLPDCGGDDRKQLNQSRSSRKTQQPKTAQTLNPSKINGQLQTIKWTQFIQWRYAKHMEYKVEVELPNFTDSVPD